MVDFHTIPTIDVGSVSTRTLRHLKEGGPELSIGVEAWNARRYPGPRMAATKLCMYSLPSVWLEQVWRLAVLMAGTVCNMSTLDRRGRAAGVASRPHDSGRVEIVEISSVVGLDRPVHLFFLNG
jgi:hypothetical protein